MGYRRGFKTEANDIARQVRAELDLRPVDPLNPWALAEHLGIPIIPLSDYTRDAPLAAAHFRSVEPDAFSAVTVFHGIRRTIVHNDAHSSGRQANNLGHEISHGLLLHPPMPALDLRGCRYWNQDLEAEAKWLGAALLISEEAALAIARSSLSIEDAACRYGVSTQLVQMRLNVTGAYERINRARRRSS